MDATFQERLENCATRVGGKRELALRADVSEAQLFRYLRGESDPTLSKLIALSQAANVSLAWLVAGDGAPGDNHNPDDLELLAALVRVLEEALLEYPGHFSPAQKGYVVALVQLAAQLERREGFESQHLNKAYMLETLHYLQALKDTEQLKLYLQGMYLLAHGKISGSAGTLFINQVSKANLALYDSKVGELYFDRASYELSQHQLQLMQKLTDAITKHLGAYANLKVLDAGCGNGRHLVYLRKFFKQASGLAGLEGSQQGVQQCRKAEAANLLPKGTVQQGDIRQLPYADQAFDVVNCMSVLAHLPYIKNSGLGAAQAISEMRRVLKPRGLLHVRTRIGTNSDFLPFEQIYTAEELRTLLTDNGFEVVELQQDDSGLQDRKLLGEVIPRKYRQMIDVWAVRKANT